MSDNYNIQNYIDGSFSVSANTEEIKNINHEDLHELNMKSDQLYCNTDKFCKFPIK